MLLNNNQSKNQEPIYQLKKQVSYIYKLILNTSNYKSYIKRKYKLIKRKKNLKNKKKNQQHNLNPLVFFSKNQVYLNKQENAFIHLRIQKKLNNYFISLTDIDKQLNAVTT